MIQSPRPESIMITRRSARTLTRYNKWANDLMFEAIAKLPTDESTQARPTLFKNIVHTMNHNYVIDRIFQAHLEGREHGYPARNTADAPALEELRRDQREVDDWYVAWSDSISDNALDERVRFT